MTFRVQDLEPFEAAVLYWKGLEAPATHVARRLRRSVEEIAQVEQRLARMGCPPPALALAGLPGYPSAIAWERRTAGDLIRRGLDRDRDEPFLFMARQGALTIDEVRSGVSRVAVGLALAGVGPGSRVAVDATQRLESYLVILATLLSGATVVALTLANGPDALRTMMQSAPATITFTSSARVLAGVPEAGRIVDLGLVTEPTTDFEEWLAQCPEPVGDGLPDVAISTGDVAIIGFTSGSTGTPKLVLTPHEAVFRQTEAMQAMFGFGADDIFMSPTELIGFSPFRSLITQPLVCGGRVVIPSPQALTQPLALAEDCAAMGVTRLTVVTNVLRGIGSAADRLSPDTWARLRTVFCGSGVLDQATQDMFVERTGVSVVDYYAAREFGNAALAYPDTTHSVCSGGGTLMNCLIRVMDERGQTLPSGQVGEVAVHSDCLALGTLAEAHPEWTGWHQTGDFGVMHADGRLQIVGRRRDIIKGADGSLIFPSEIETHLNTLEWVRESCVMGWQPDGEPEQIVAALILKRPVRDYQSIARQHLLKNCGQYRTPKKIFEFEEFPRVGLSKVDKAKLRSILRPALEDAHGSDVSYS